MPEGRTRCLCHGKNTQKGVPMRRRPDSPVPQPLQPRQRPRPLSAVIIRSATASSVTSASSLPAVAGSFRGMGRTLRTDSPISPRARPLLQKTPTAATVTKAQVMAACPRAHGSHSCTCGFHMVSYRFRWRQLYVSVQQCYDQPVPLSSSPSVTLPFPDALRNPGLVDVVHR